MAFSAQKRLVPRLSVPKHAGWIGFLSALLLSPIAFAQSPCDDATAQVNQVCCQDQTSWGGSTSSVNMLNCVTGQREQVPCIPRASMPGGGALSDQQVPFQTEMPDGQSPVWPGQSPDCQLALRQMDAVCPPLPPEAPPFELQCQTESATALVTCESLQRLDAVLTATNCRLYSSEAVTHELELLIETPFREMIARAENDPLQTVFEDTSGILDPGAPHPLARTLIPPGRDSRAVPFLRIELPGNFLRYQLQNSAIPQALRQLGQTNGFSCNPNALSCAINPLKVADLKPALNAMNGPNFQISVRDTSNGYEITDVTMGTLGDLLGITAHWVGSLRVQPRGNAGFDLKNDANLTPIPLHDPVDRNGYPTDLSPLDRAHSYLDSAIVVTRVERNRCAYFDNLVIDGVVANRAYTAHMQPLLCSCGDNDPAKNYCIFDAYPRDRQALTDATLADLHGDPRLIYCDGNFRIDRDPVQRAQPTPSNSIIAEIDLATLCSATSIPAETCTNIANDVRRFGCTGSTLKRLVPHPSPNPDQPGRPVTSAAGVGMGAKVELGGLELLHGTSHVEVSLELGVKIEEWFKLLRKRWFGFSFFRWVLNLILRLLSGVLSAAATVTTMFPPNHQWIMFGSHQLMVDGLLSHRTVVEPNPADPATLVQRPQISAGVRRLWTDLPLRPDKVSFELADVQWDFHACSQVSLFGSGSLIEKLIRLHQCGFESVSNVVRIAVNPVIRFFYHLLDLFVDIGAKLKKLVSNTVVTEVGNMEKSNELAQLLASTVRTVAMAPYYLNGNAADAPATMLVDLSGLTTSAERADKTTRTQPPGLSQTCLLHPNAAPACLLSHLFTGSAYSLMSVEIQRQFEIVRMGAKTHYRSLQDFDPAALDSDFPPVRFCQQGDNPPGASAVYRPETHAILTDFSDAGRALPLKRLTDFKDVHVSQEITPLPLDWRTQCAVFADLKVLGDVQLSSSVVPQHEIKVVPTQRTNVLLNEVFFCKDNPHCNPTMLSLPDGQAMRQRAELAICSMGADLWYRTSPPGIPLASQPFQSALDNATSPQISQLVHNTVCPVMGPLAARCHQAATDLVSMLASCRPLLEGAGWVVPTTIPPDP